MSWQWLELSARQSFLAVGRYGLMRCNARGNVQRTRLEEFMMNFDVFVSFLMTLPQFLLMLLVLVLLDLALGVVRAVMEYEFDWEELPKFLLVCASYLLAWIAAEVLAMLPAIFGIDVAGYGEAIADVTPKLVYALIVLKYVASVVKHIRYFLSDLADA